MRALANLMAILMLVGCAMLSEQPDTFAMLGAGPDQMVPAHSRMDIPEPVDGLIVGHRLMAAGEYEIALREYHRAAAARGATVDVLSAIGSANLRLGRLSQAEQDLRRALEIDQTFVPALNNLGVVLAEKDKWGEAQLHFRNAFVFDKGRSTAIRENLRLAIEIAQRMSYDEPEASSLLLMRRGAGRYILLSTP
ncbi:MAG: tetratricopeptide repeat protein [Roseinatronobacter sp.]